MYTILIWLLTIHIAGCIWSGRAYWNTTAMFRFRKLMQDSWRKPKNRFTYRSFVIRESIRCAFTILFEANIWPYELYQIYKDKHQ